MKKKMRSDSPRSVSFPILLPLLLSLAAVTAGAGGAPPPPASVVVVVCDTKRAINDSLVDAGSLAVQLPALVAALRCGALRVPLLPDRAAPRDYPAAHNATAAFARARGLLLYASPMEGAWAALGADEGRYARWAAEYAAAFAPDLLSPFNEVGAGCGADCMHRVATAVRAALPPPQPPRTAVALAGPDAEHVAASAALVGARADRLAVFDVVGSHNAGGDASNTRAQWAALAALAGGRPLWSSENPACFSLQPCTRFGSMGEAVAGGAAAVVLWNALGDDLLLNLTVTAKGLDIASHLHAGAGGAAGGGGAAAAGAAAAAAAAADRRR